MNKSNKSKYYIVEGGQFLAWAAGVRTRTIKTYKDMSDYYKSIGGTNANEIGGSMVEIQFEQGEAPKGFNKQDRDGFCAPRKGSKYDKEMSKIKLPNECLEFVKKTGLRTWISYDRKDGVRGGGGFRIGSGIYPVRVCWLSPESPLLLVVPDVAGCTEHLDNDVYDIKNNDHLWRIDEDGLKEVLLEEWRLMEAKHKQAKDAK